MITTPPFILSCFAYTSTVYTSFGFDLVFFLQNAYFLCLCGLASLAAAEKYVVRTPAEQQVVLAGLNCRSGSDDVHAHNVDL